MHTPMQPEDIKKGLRRPKTAQCQTHGGLGTCKETHQASACSSSSSSSTPTLPAWHCCCSGSPHHATHVAQAAAVHLLAAKPPAIAAALASNHTSPVMACMAHIQGHTSTSAASCLPHAPSEQGPLRTSTPAQPCVQGLSRTYTRRGGAGAKPVTVPTLLTLPLMGSVPCAAANTHMQAQPCALLSLCPFLALRPRQSRPSPCLYILVCVSWLS